MFIQKKKKKKKRGKRNSANKNTGKPRLFKHTGRRNSSNNWVVSTVY